MLVRDVMTTDIVTVDVNATLQTVAEELLANGVGSVVVTRGGDPSGLVTESDALRVAAETGKPLSDIPIEPLCEQPVVTTSPDTSVQTVTRRMIEEDVKKFPVLDDLDIVGIVTLTDVVFHLSDIRQEATELAERHYDWSTG